MRNNFSEESIWINETYDRYAGMLYSVLLDLCESKAGAEGVLVKTFERLHTEHYFSKGQSIGLVVLVKLAVDTAKNHVSLKTPPCIKTFQQSPMLHHFLFDNVSIESLCKNSGLTRVEIARKVRTELGQVQAITSSKLNNEQGLHFFPGQH